MATNQDIPQDADSEQLDRSAAAIQEAKAAAGRVAKEDSIGAGDLPTARENVPGVRPAEDAGTGTAGDEGVEDVESGGRPGSAQGEPAGDQSDGT